MVNIILEFSGGLELLFSNQKDVTVDIPSNDNEKITVAEAIRWARENLLTARPELFMKGETVRPGILVLVNDADWELCGTLECELSSGDKLAFISTLHGG